MHQSADRVQVEYWWGRWPEANVGVVTGAVSDLAVIDVDPRHDGETTLYALETTRDRLPPTLESDTGGGGRHLWFTIPGEAPPSADLGAGLELKAERGVIVAPPSRHYSGGLYRWREPIHEPVPLPDWVSALASGHGYRHDTPAEAPIRTSLEQEEFRELWARAGVQIGPGDGYYLCPFHEDHHPSLHIDAEGCRWYCFACHIGGGVGRLARRLGLTRPQVLRERLRGRVGRERALALAGDERVEVVGESFHQSELLGLTGGRRRYGGVDLEAVAELVPLEDDGIEVRIEDKPVGFLDQEDAERFDARIADALDLTGAATCRAAIRGGWDRGGDDLGLFGVTLYLPGDD